MTMKIMNFEMLEIRNKNFLLKSGSEHMRHLLDSQIRNKKDTPRIDFVEFVDFENGINVSTDKIFFICKKC